MIECLKEITPLFPQNTYVISSGKLIAYKSYRSDEWKEFAAPPDFSKTGRKFVKVPVPSQFNVIDSNVKVVLGSKGDKYFIKNGKCSCPGFQFREKCKHIV